MNIMPVRSFRPAHDMSSVPIKDRLIVALDVPTTDQASAIVKNLGDAVSFYKIGMQLQFAGGIAFVDQLISRNKKVFLDSKLFDIDETISRAVENVARMGVYFLTVHGNGKTIRAAVHGRGTTDLKILSVTVLTSLDAADMADLGYEGVNIEKLALFRAGKALEAGADGVITSGKEAAAIREMAGSKLTIVTPGVRPDGTPINDQKRVVTPREAIRNGADYVVVGRPVLQASDPRKMAEGILGEIERALSER